jgi:hypothetical protein
VRRPRHTADGVGVALEQSQGTGGRSTQVEGPDHAVDARGRDEGLAVLVPVVGEAFRGREGGLRLFHRDRVVGGGAVDGDLEREVVGGRGWGAEVPDAEVRVGADRTEDAVGVRGPLDGVGAGEGEEGGARALRVPDLDGVVPRGAREGGFRGEVPGAREGFARVFGEGGDGELGGKGGVVEAEGAIAGGGEQVARGDL